MNLRILSKISKEFLAPCHHIVTGVTSMVHPHLPKGISIAILGVSMEDGKVVHLFEAIKIVTRNPIGSWVGYSMLMLIIFLVVNCFTWTSL